MRMIVAVLALALSTSSSSGAQLSPVLVKDINPGPGGSYPLEITNVNGTLFFTANDGSHGWQLWKSDGTTNGTAVVTPVDFGVGPPPPDGFFGPGFIGAIGN